MKKLYDMVENDLYNQYPSNDAHWIFTEFGMLMEHPDYDRNISLCINIAVEKWKEK